MLSLYTSIRILKRKYTVVPPARRVTVIPEEATISAIRR